MINATFKLVAASFLIALVSMLLAACGSEAELSRSEVESIVREELEAVPEPAAGLSRADVEEIVGAAIGGLPEPDAGLSRSEAERIARDTIASIPLKSDPAGYTKFFVENAIRRYEADGLDATLAYYNSVGSVDGQWYVFIIDENDMTIGHYNPLLLGLDLNGPLGTDANGYNFGPEMLSAAEEGKWVTYVYWNPESGSVGSDFRQMELKNVWVVRHDGLLFASGWYINADEFTKKLVSVAVEEFRSGGLQATLDYFASPGSVLAGLETTYRVLQPDRHRRRQMGRVHSRRKRRFRSPLRPRDDRDEYAGAVRPGASGGFAGRQLGVRGIDARMGKVPWRACIRLGLAPRAR